LAELRHRHPVAAREIHASQEDDQPGHEERLSLR
jgi:hypothetical protein